MISIRHSLNELEACDRARALALDCYVAAIRNAADYAIDFNDTITGPHRKHLSALAAEVDSSGPGVLERSLTTFSGLLRDFRDRAAGYLGVMREDIASTTHALEEVLGSLCQADGDHEKCLRGSLGRLRAISALPEARPLRAGLAAEVDTIDQSLEEIRRQHQLTVSQFQVEIRALHKRIDELESAVAVGNLTKLVTRSDMEQRLRAAPAAGQRLLLIRVQGLRVPVVAAELTAAFARRLRNCLPSSAVIGRWNDDGFVAMLPTGKPEAIARGKAIADQLSGAYACLQDGKTVRPSIQLSVAVVDCAGETPERVLARLRAFLTSE
jgi:GGDEF domain-containing protein